MLSVFFKDNVNHDHEICVRISLIMMTIAWPHHAAQIHTTRLWMGNFPQQTRGLIYKTVRRKVTKSVRTVKSQSLRTPENIRTYKTMRTLTCKQFPLYKSQHASTFAQTSPPYILPATRPNSTINGQCKAPHECQCVFKWPS